MKQASIFVSLAIALLGILGGCDRDDARTTAPGGPASAPAAVTPPPTTASPATTTPATAAGPRVVFLGDSLTAGLGLEAAQAYPQVVADLLAAEGLPARIVNAGVSGDTTAGGLRRLDWQLKQSPDVVVVALGGNDGLRGLELRASEENLRAIIQKCKAAGANVLLVGMLIPPNYGPDYTTKFRDLYPRLAKELNVPLVPFLLEGVGGDPKLNQPDGIHPTAEGQRRVAENVLPALREMVRQKKR